MKPDLSGAAWRQFTRSNGSGACVEVATNLPGVVAVRDTKDGGAGPVLTFIETEWGAFVGGVRDSEFDR